MKTATQNIKELLEAGKSISPAEAFAQFSVIRLGGIIYNLKKQGMKIVTEMKKDAVGHRYARYSLETEV